MLDPIIKTIEVPCSQEKAFGVFVKEVGSWWPLAKRSMSLMRDGYGSGWVIIFEQAYKSACGG